MKNNVKQSLKTAKIKKYLSGLMIKIEIFMNKANY